jgi:hypothetical protein
MNALIVVAAILSFSFMMMFLMCMDVVRRDSTAKHNTEPAVTMEERLVVLAYMADRLRAHYRSGLRTSCRLLLHAITLGEELTAVRRERVIYETSSIPRVASPDRVSSRRVQPVRASYRQEYPIQMSNEVYFWS